MIMMMKRIVLITISVFLLSSVTYAGSIGNKIEPIGDMKFAAVAEGNFIFDSRHVNFMTFSLTKTLFRYSFFKVSLRGTKCRSNPVARDCFASLAMTLIRTAMILNKIISSAVGK